MQNHCCLSMVLHSLEFMAFKISIDSRFQQGEYRMLSGLGSFWAGAVGKIAGVTIKGWMLLSAAIAGTVVVAGVSGAAIVVHNEHQEARFVVITINGINT